MNAHECPVCGSEYIRPFPPVEFEYYCEDCGEFFTIYPEEE